MSAAIDDITMSFPSASYSNNGAPAAFTTTGLGHARAVVRFHLRRGQLYAPVRATGAGANKVVTDLDSPRVSQQLDIPQFSLTSTCVLFFLIGLALPISYSSITFKTEFFESCVGYGQPFVRTYLCPRVPPFSLNAHVLLM